MRRVALKIVTIAAFLPIACQPGGTTDGPPSSAEDGSAAPADAASVAELSDADRRAIESVDAAAARAGVAGDFDAFAALYTEDAVLLPPNAPAVRGRAAIRDFWASVPTITAFDIDVEEIVGRGDLAYVQGTYVLELTPPGAAEPIRDEGKFIEIRRRQPDGSWPLARDIYNSDLPATP